MVELNIMPRPSQKPMQSYVSTMVSEPAVIHLNGIAGLNHKFRNNGKEDEDINIYSFLSRIDRNSSLEEALEQILYLFSSTEKGESGILETFAFAFETQYKLTQKVLEEAKNVISKTDKLIIIGYSIPKYNDAFDIQLFSQLKDTAEIVIKDYNDVSNRLIQEYGISKDRIHWIGNDFEMTSFYIPKELRWKGKI